MITQEQNFTEGNKTSVDIPPPPPRGSPDFNHFLDADESSQRINSAVGNLVNELLEDTRKPSPREPIHLTLPSAEVYEDANEDRVDFDDDMEDDIDKWIEEKKKYNEKELNIDEILNGFEEKLEIGSIPSKLLRTDIGGSAEELCEDFISSDSEEENQNDKKTTGRNRKKDVHVTFDEEKNKTRTITPREEDSYVTVTSIQGSKRKVATSASKPDSAANHYRATPDLRNISSKISSNPRPHTATGKRIERRHRKQTSQTNSIEHCHSTGRQSPNKQHVPLSTISVTYLEDEDGINDSQTLRRSKSRGHSEVETVISQFLSSDSESEEESRPDSRTKAVSKYSNRNYYQLSTDEDRPKVLTRKTLELGDGTVIERKSVFLLDNHKQAHKSYVVPMENRPKSASAVNRPKSATKTEPHTAPNKAEKEKQSVVHEPRSVLVAQETSKYSSVQIKRPKSGKKYDTDSPCESEKKDTSAVDSTESTGGVKSKKEVTFADVPEVRTVGTHDCKCVTASADRTKRPHSAPCKSVYRRPGSGRSTQSKEDNVKYSKPFSLVKHKIDEERRKQMLDNVPQITTKYREYEVEDSEGVKECKEMQGYLTDAGVPFNLDTLYRLVSKPCYWLPEEYKRLVQAKKLVRQANLSLWYQEREEEREALKAAGITITAKKKKKKRRNGKKIAADHSRLQSAPSGQQMRLRSKRIRSAPPGARKKPEDTATDHISLQDLM